MKDQRAREARRYLQSVQYADRHIDSLLNEVYGLRLKAQIASSCADGERVQGSGFAEGHMEGIVIRIIELEAQVDAEIDELVDKRKKVNAMLDMLPDEREAVILRMRYFDRAEWDIIADSVYLERRQMFRLHVAALIHLHGLLTRDA